MQQFSEQPIEIAGREATHVFENFGGRADHGLIVTRIWVAGDTRDVYTKDLFFSIFCYSDTN
jgi:hypothetical protein